MQVYHIHASWEVGDVFEVIAGSEEEAILLAERKPRTEGTYLNGSFEVMHDLIEQFTMNDRNGAFIHIGMTVSVPDPIETDLYTHAFTGSVVAYHEAFISVQDGEGDVFDIEPERVTILQQQNEDGGAAGQGAYASL